LSLRDAHAIDSVGRADEERAIATQVLAFATDPVMRWLFPEQNTYLQQFPRFARAFAAATVHMAARPHPSGRERG
jgi:hypothetical protein